MRTTSILLTLSFMALGSAWWPTTAQATCANGRSEIIGQLPDVFFTPGVPATRTFQYSYQNFGGDVAECGLLARSITSGVSVHHTYGSSTTPPAGPFEWAAVGPSTSAGYDKTWTLSIVYDGSAPDGTRGAVEIVQNHVTENFHPVHPRLIGTVNVYISSREFDTTYVTQASRDNTWGSLLFLDHPALNGVSSARVFVMPTYNPADLPRGLVDAHPVGVSYFPWFGRWVVSHRDGSPMPQGASFNVRVDPSARAHRATSSTIVGDGTRISDPSADGNPHAVLLVTERYQSGYDEQPFGVRYSAGAWWIHHTNGEPMRAGRRYFVKVLGRGVDLAEYGATGNRLSNGVAVDLGGAARTYATRREVRYSYANPRAALVFVTPNTSPGGARRPADVHPLGVYYTQRADWSGWSVYHQDSAWMSNDTAYNIWVPADPVRGRQLATFGNLLLAR